jgi:hypothetical protein
MLYYVFTFKNKFFVKNIIEKDKYKNKINILF